MIFIAQLGAWQWTLVIVAALIVLIALYDILQKRHAILRNFPLIGHFRYWLESVGPELRQYIVTSNDEERPFSRDQRRWIYASAKKQNNYFGFGTDNDLETTSNTLIIKHASFPLSQPHAGDADYDPLHIVPSAKIWGAARKRKHAFRPNSIVNISAMSYGSLSSAAVSAMNRGAKIAGALHNTGEGGISPYHLEGGDLIWQLGTGYFGCRSDDGRCDMKKLIDAVAAHPVRAIEIKLSQGAKPGVGGVLPAAKISAEISKIRGIPMGKDCLSPSQHHEFRCIDSMLDFVERIADATGVPVGIKSAVGQLEFWRDLAQQMTDSSRGVDFITVDGGEGGTGAAPLVFSDHVALPFKLGMAAVYREFAERGVHTRVAFVGSGRLGFPEEALFAFALGCDVVSVAREAMLAVGCIQALRCHTGHCPTGVATQNRWLVRGLDPHDKGARMGNYLIALRKEIIALCRACGVEHPAFITPQHLLLINGNFGSESVGERFNYDASWGALGDADSTAIRNLMSPAS